MGVYILKFSPLGGAVQSFLYTDQQLGALEETLSAERLQPYRAMAEGDPIRALKLYERNTGLSESFYSVLQGLEVALRNSVHRTLTAELGRPDWYDSGFLNLEQLRPLDRRQGGTESGREATRSRARSPER